MKFLCLILVLVLLGCDTITDDESLSKSNAEKLIGKWEIVYEEIMTVDSIVSEVPIEDRGTLDFRSNKMVYTEIIKPSDEVLLDSAVWSATETNMTLISFDQDTVNLSYFFITDTLKTIFLMSNGETQFHYFLEQ